VARLRHAPAAPHSRQAAEVSRLTEELTGQLHASLALVRWCDQRAGVSAQAAGCDDLRASTAQSGQLVAQVAAHGQTPAQQLRVSLAALEAHMGRVDVRAKAVDSAAAAQRAADIRSVETLAVGYARREVPVRIPLHASAIAVVALDHPLPDDPQLLARLSAHLTVVKGDAVQVGGLRTVRPEQVGGALKWEWTLVGARAGEVDVHTELVIDPPSAAAAGPTPVVYKTWDDHISVAPAESGGILLAIRGANPWLLLGGAAAGVLLTGLWLWRRNRDPA
jgi:hypothetical protein